jgi:predicted YcjX-like family ATPase
MRFGDLPGEALVVAQSLADAATGLLDPTLRLGVTGLARSGKTVFITALVNALMEGGRLPVFRAYKEGRLAGARVTPQPDDAVPRFEVEDHLAALIGSRRWPESTRRVSELRVVIDYGSQSFWRRRGGGNSRLTLDIVDYPGEWLLDLGLLGQTYAEWSRRTIEASRRGSRAPLAGEWHAYLATLDPAAKEDEAVAKRAAELFTAYLRACREERWSLSTLPPGRFLLPGDLEGSPALTFAPLDMPADVAPRNGTLGAMMQRRYDSYVDHIVRPFFREHFARLDRQIVLVDVLAALNAGPDAVADLEAALADVLEAFRHGRNSWLTGLFRPKVDRVLFAATKADHLHHTSHDRLEAILRRLVERAAAKAEFAGAEVDVVALAAVRATREGRVRRDGAELPVIIGTPEKGSFFGHQAFDGEEEFAIYPGELPADPDLALTAGGFRGHGESGDGDLRFPRFRPPLLVPGTRQLPHIRLDRAMEFLMGDKLA